MLSKKLYRRKNFIVPKHHDRWLVTEKTQLSFELSEAEVRGLKERVEAIRLVRFFYQNIDPVYSNERLKALANVANKFTSSLRIPTAGFIVAGSTSMGLAVPVSDLESYIITSRRTLRKLGYNLYDKKLIILKSSKGDLTKIQAKINDYLEEMGYGSDVFLLGIIDTDKIFAGDVFETARLIAASFTGVSTETLEQLINKSLDNEEATDLTYKLLKLHFTKDICNGYAFSLLKKYPARIGYKFKELPKDIQHCSKLITQPL